MPDIKSLLKRIFTPARLMIGAALVLAFVILLLLFDRVLMPWYTKHGESLAVPNAVAMRFEAAKDLLEENGLVPLKGGEKYDANLPFGYVVEQHPAANRRVKLGRRVYLTISVGEPEIEVPNLVGISEKNALERLKSSGLRSGDILYEYVPGEEANKVIAQSHQAGQLVKVSEPIDFTVSLGSPTEQVSVPSVLGKTLEAATRAIQKAGLTVGEVSYRANNDFLPNTVINQSLEAGAPAKPGDPIDLLVTRIGPE